MTLFNKIAIAAVGVVLGVGGIQGQANAVSLGAPPLEEGPNIVTNGEFEQTGVEGDWLRTKNVPGWETDDADGEFELWNQGRIGSPLKGSDGSETGNHLETNLDGIAKVWQTFKLGDNIGKTATFSFDAWSRQDENGILGTGIVSVLGSLSGEILNTAIKTNGDNWTQNIFGDLSVKAGEEITIAFIGNENSSVSSPHIDQVSFVVNKLPESVPEPASILGILAVGAFGTVSKLKHKRRQEA